MDDDEDGNEVVSKLKTVQHKLLPTNIPLHPLWHYYEVMSHVCNDSKSYSGQIQGMRPSF